MLTNHLTIDYTYRGQQYKAVAFEVPGTPYSWHITPYNAELTSDLFLPITVFWNDKESHYEHKFHPLINAIVKGLVEIKGENWKPFSA